MNLSCIPYDYPIQFSRFSFIRLTCYIIKTMDWPYKKKKCVQKLRDSVFYDGRSRRTNFSCGFLRIFFFFFLLREKQQKSRPIRRGIFHWLDRRRLRARGTGASGRFLAQWPQGAHQADCVHFFVSFVFRHFCWRRAFVSLSLCRVFVSIGSSAAYMYSS